MNIVVCIKRVPETAEADIAIDATGTGIRSEHLAFGTNEWDDYAVEEAVRIVEVQGGHITVVTLGPDDSQGILRRALAMGADAALHLNDPAFSGGDSFAVATALHAALRDIPFDLLLTGVQAGDDGCGQVGALLGQLFGVPSACMVTRIAAADGKALLQRELEGGMAESCEISLPAVLTVQTGINDPRYVSIMGIRKAKGKPLSLLTASDIGLSPDQTGIAGSLTELMGISLPVADKTAQMLQGDMGAVSKQVLAILKEKGGCA